MQTRTQQVRPSPTPKLQWKSCAFSFSCFYISGSIFEQNLPLSTRRQGLVAVLPFVIPAPLGHASLTPSLSRDGRLCVVVLLSEAALGVDNIDAPDDDVDDNDDEPLQEFCLQIMASGKTIRKRRAWLRAYFAPKGSRMEGNDNGMTRTLNGKQEQGTRRSFPGARCPWRPGMASGFPSIAS